MDVLSCPHFSAGVVRGTDIIKTSDTAQIPETIRVPSKPNLRLLFVAVFYGFWLGSMGQYVLMQPDRKEILTNQSSTRDTAMTVHSAIIKSLARISLDK